jgi:hypothetical protein
VVPSWAVDDDCDLVLSWKWVFIVRKWFVAMIERAKGLDANLYLMPRHKTGLPPHTQDQKHVLFGFAIHHTAV